MELGAEGKIAVSCGTWGSARTHVYLKGIYYSGQEATEEGKHITGTVADEDGNPISGAQIAAGRLRQAKTEHMTWKFPLVRIVSLSPKLDILIQR